MRIGIDTRLKNQSGVGRYIRNLVNWLQRIDNKNEYILINPNVKWHTIKEQLVMPFVFHKERFDLVHFPYFNVPLFYFGKFVVTIHDLTISHFSTGRASTLNPLLYTIKRMGYKFVLWNAIYRSKKIIVPTNAVKKEILKHSSIDPEKIVVIYEGSNLKFKIRNLKLKEAIDMKWNIKPDNYFLYVGNAYPHKNLNRLILAFRKILTKSTISWKLSRKDLKLILVGKEDFFYKRLKKKVKELKLENNVVFTGYVSDKELSWLYQNARAFVFPSLMEGFGLPALEAMQNKCLVLASDIPTLKEIYENAAVYFNPQDTHDLAVTMREVIEHPKKYKQKIEIGLKRTSEFSWERMAQETLKVYEDSVSI